MIDVKIEITMKGDLYKWTDAISGWKLIYAEIQNGELLCYDKKDGNLQNTVSLMGCIIEAMLNESEKIVLQLPHDKILYLKFKTMADKVKWVNAFSNLQYDKSAKSIHNSEIIEGKNTNIELSKEGIVKLLRNNLLSDSSKLAAYTNGGWMVQKRLDNIIENFITKYLKVNSDLDTIKINIESIKHYTAELKVVSEINNSFVPPKF